MSSSSSLELASVRDGRTLGYAVFGDPGGRPLVAFHGAPGSRLDFTWMDAPLRARGIRLICPDRPGHGRSSPKPDRTLLDWADDVEDLADHLELDRFAVLGHSGGAPYTLPCALAYRDRLDAVILTGAAGRMDRPGAYDGMTLSDRQLTWMAMRAPLMGKVVLSGFSLLARSTPTVPWRIMRDELSHPDRQVLGVLGEPAVAMANFVEAFRPGTEGVLLDFRLLTEPWGFALEDVPGEVWIWHGDHDRTVPLHQARDLAEHIPGAHFELLHGEGHLLLVNHLDDVLRAAGLPHQP